MSSSSSKGQNSEYSSNYSSDQEDQTLLPLSDNSYPWKQNNARITQQNFGYASYYSNVVETLYSEFGEGEIFIIKDGK